MVVRSSPAGGLSFWKVALAQQIMRLRQRFE
jgi:hypothetical protein